MCFWKSFSKQGLDSTELIISLQNNVMLMLNSLGDSHRYLLLEI